MLTKYRKIKNKKLFFSILVSTLFFSFIVKLLPFYILIKVLKRQKKLPILKYELDEILKYEKKISRKMKIKQCLIRMSVLFSIFKKNSYNPKLFIGVGNDRNFQSHAWLKVENIIVDLDERKKYKSIMEIE